MSVSLLQPSIKGNRQFVYSLLIILISCFVFYYLILFFGGSQDLFFEKAAVSLGGRALSLVLCKGLGCSGGLALAMGFAARALFASEAPAALLHFMNEDGSAGAVDASTSGASDESSSSSSEEVSVSEDASEVEEVADSTPQFWGKWEEPERELYDRAKSLFLREEIDEEYFHDIPRNLGEVAALGEGAYQAYLEFEEFEVGMVEKRSEIKDRLIDLFSNDNDPEVVKYKQGQENPTIRLPMSFRDFDEEVLSGPIETWDRSAPGFRERAQDHIYFFHNDLFRNGRNSMTYKEFKKEVLEDIFID